MKCVKISHKQWHSRICPTTTCNVVMCHFTCTEQSWHKCKNCSSTPFMTELITFLIWKRRIVRLSSQVRSRPSLNCGGCRATLPSQPAYPARGRAEHIHQAVFSPNHQLMWLLTSYLLRCVPPAVFITYVT